MGMMSFQNTAMSALNPNTSGFGGGGTPIFDFGGGQISATSSPLAGGSIPSSSPQSGLLSMIALGLAAGALVLVLMRVGGQRK